MKISALETKDNASVILSSSRFSCALTPPNFSIAKNEKTTSPLKREIQSSTLIILKKYLLIKKPDATKMISIKAILKNTNNINLKI